MYTFTSDIFPVNPVQPDSRSVANSPGIEITSITVNGRNLQPNEYTSASSPGEYVEHICSWADQDFSVKSSIIPASGSLMERVYEENLNLIMLDALVEAPGARELVTSVRNSRPDSEPAVILGERGFVLRLRNNIYETVGAAVLGCYVTLSTNLRAGSGEEETPDVIVDLSRRPEVPHL